MGASPLKVRILLPALSKFMREWRNGRRNTVESEQLNGLSTRVLLNFGAVILGVHAGFASQFSGFDPRQLHCEEKVHLHC